mgnify:FL=1
MSCSSGLPDLPDFHCGGNIIFSANPVTYGAWIYKSFLGTMTEEQLKRNELYCVEIEDYEGACEYRDELINRTVRKR